LLGEVAQALRANLYAPQRTSYRWVLSATLVSLAFAVVLFCAVFLFNVIPSAMYSSETGWTDFTEEQISSMKFWYLILLCAGVALIFLFFSWRSSKHDV
jgi:uncharacterized membrane protein YdcZ (DUF606 family)